MFRALMPEAAVNEDRWFEFGEDAVSAIIGIPRP
jgi:hypothetical protein